MKVHVTNTTARLLVAFGRNILPNPIGEVINIPEDNKKAVDLAKRMLTEPKEGEFDRRPSSVKAGYLKVKMGEAGAKVDQTAGPVGNAPEDIRKLSEKEAIAKVNASSSVQELQAFWGLETREPVKAAIQARGDKLSKG